MGCAGCRGTRCCADSAIAASLSVLGMQMTAAIFVLFAQDLLDLSDRWYGLLIAIGAIGAVAGGLVAERLSKRLGSLRIIYGTVIVWILCMFAEGFWPRLWVSAIATMAMAFGTTVWNTVTVSLRQRIVPANLFGRVNSVYRWLVWGSISIGSALGGLVAREFGLRAPFFIGAAFGLVALITLFFSITPQSLAALGRHAGHRRRHTCRDGHRSLPVARMTSEASSEMHVRRRAPGPLDAGAIGSSLLSAEAYTDAAWFAAERQMIFGDWLGVGRLRALARGDW